MITKWFRSLFRIRCPKHGDFPLCYYVFKQVPSDQAVIHDGVELTGHVWIRPAEAIKQYEQ